MSKAEEADKYVKQGLSIKEACKKVGLVSVSGYYGWRSANKKAAKSKARAIVLPRAKPVVTVNQSAIAKMIVFYGTPKELAAVARELQ